jgi:hypothetical protein
MNTVQAIFQKYYTQYKEEYSPSEHQAKVAQDIINCRTEALGGHLLECEECGYISIQYNSCRNRHCSQCQGVEKVIWIDKRSNDILNAPYFHLVFTIPVPLQQLIYQNQELLYKLMYKAVAETISELSNDKKYLGAQVGFFSLLHTWGQNLHYHPHIHVVVLAGGLTKLNKWQSSSKKFFIPVKTLSKKFRGKYLYNLKQYYNQGILRFYGKNKTYKEPKNFQTLLNNCYKECWYSYTQQTFSGPLAVIKYLGRYTNRIAISNSRIVSIGEDTVTISIKDYKDGNKTKQLTMKGIEFIRRFLLHVLPKGFVKIRHFGILANRNKKTKLELCRKLTSSPKYIPKFEGLTTLEVLCLLAGKDILLCPSCKEKRLEQVLSFVRGSSP